MAETIKKKPGMKRNHAPKADDIVVTMLVRFLIGLLIGGVFSLALLLIVYSPWVLLAVPVCIVIVMAFGASIYGALKAILSLLSWP